MALLTGIWDWRVQTGIIDERMKPNGFLRNLIFGDRFNLNAAENLEITVYQGGRSIAPFVKKGSAAQLIRGYGDVTRVITPPMLRNKMEFEPHKYLDRAPAGVVSIVKKDDQSGISRSAKEKMRRDAEAMNNFADDAEEFLVGMMLGNAAGASVLEYNVAMGAGEETVQYQLTYPRAAENLITLTGTDQWDDAAMPDPAISIRTAKTRLAEVGLTPTICIMGSNVGAAFVANTKVMANLDVRRLNQAGPVMLGGQMPPGFEGATYEGEYAGLPMWTYDRKVNILGPGGDVAKADHDIIDPNSCYILSITDKAQFSMEYGGIRDMEALELDLLETRRFMKAWTENDPSGAWKLMESHPLPVPGMVDSVVQILAVS